MAAVPKLKPGAKPVPSAAQASATQGNKKLSSRGERRSARGLASHPAPPPPSPAVTPPCRPSPAPTPKAPAQPDVRFGATDIRAKQGIKLPTIRSGFGQEEGDLCHHLDWKAQGEGSKPPSGKGQSRQDRKERQGGSQSSSSSSGTRTKHHHKAPSSGRRGRGLAAPLPLLPVQALPGLALPRGRFGPFPLGLPVQVMAEIPLPLAEAAADGLQLDPLLESDIRGTEAGVRLGRGRCWCWAGPARRGGCRRWWWWCGVGGQPPG